MGILGAIVDTCFRDDKTGRVVVFPGDGRKRGYLVKSDADEQKIRAFLLMFYSAHFAIFVLGYFLASEWSRDIYHLHLLGNPADHLLRNGMISVGAFLVVVGLPYFLLWRSYKNTRMSFVTAEDEVLVTVGRPRQSIQWKLLAIGLVIAGLAILLAALWLVTSTK
jgi:hypothetical protein